MDYRELELFVDLSSTLHFGRTSQNCNISPSALSRAIQRLEDEVGTALLNRDNRSVSLTNAGASFLEYARDVLNRWDELKYKLDRVPGDVAGELRLYSSVTACYAILPEIIQRYRQLYPNVHIRLQTGDAASAVSEVLNEDADLSIAAKPDQLPSGICFEHILETPLCFIAPVMKCSVRELLDDKPVMWEDVPMIAADKGLSRKRVDLWFRRKHIHPFFYAEVSGNEAIISMVSLGCGIGVVPALVTENSPLRDKIKVLDIKPELPRYAVGLCADKRRLNVPQVKAFWELVTKGANSPE